MGKKLRLPPRMRQQQTACKNIEEGSQEVWATTILSSPCSPWVLVMKFLTFTFTFTCTCIRRIILANNAEGFNKHYPTNTLAGTFK